MTNKTEKPPRRPVTTTIQRRAETLKVILLDPNTKALAAEVPMSGLIAYLAELRDLGLIDVHERLTQPGAFYRALVFEALALAKAQGVELTEVTIERRAVWNIVGGDEKMMDKAFAALIDKGLVQESGDGGAREYALL